MISSKLTAPRPGERKIPSTARIAEIQMASQNSGFAVERNNCVFDMHVINAVWKSSKEFNRIDSLPQKMAWIEIKTELGAMINGFEGTLCCIEIEGNFRRVNFERELYAAFFINCLG